MKPLQCLNRWLRRAVLAACASTLGLCCAQSSLAQPSVDPAATRWTTVRGSASDVVISTGGDAYALDEGGNLWRLPVDAIRHGKYEGWTLQPGRFARLRATQDGALWGLDAAGLLYRQVGSVWQPQAEGVRDVAATADGLVAVLTTTDRIRYPALQQEIALPPGGGAPSRLVADEHGLLWLSLTDGRVLRRSGGQWVEMASGSAPLYALAIGANGNAFAVNGAGDVLLRAPQTGLWQPYPKPAALQGQVTQIALDARGLPWLLDRRGGLSAERLVHERAGIEAKPPALFTRLLTWRPVGGQAQGVALGGDGSAFSLGANGAVWQWLGEDQWRGLGGKFRAIAAGNKGAAWGLDERGAVHALDSGFWSPLPGTVQHIAAGGRPASLWAVSPDNNLLRWNGAARQWDRLLQMPFKVQALAIGPAGEPWVIDAEGTVQWLQGTEWKSLGGITASALAVGPEGTVYAVTAKEQGIYWLDKRELQWKPATGNAIAIAVGAEGAPWAVSPGNVVLASGRFLREEAERVQAAVAAAAPPPPVLTFIAGPPPTLQKTLSFQPVQMPDASFQDIGIGSNGAVFALGSEGSLYCFNNASKRFVLASLGKARRVAVAPSGLPWLLNQTGIVSFFDKGAWQSVPDFVGQDIAVGPDGVVWAVDVQGESYRYALPLKRFERVAVLTSDVPTKATRIAGAASNVYWIVGDGKLLIRCERGNCKMQLMGIQDVAVDPGGTVFALDLLGAVRRYNPATRQFEKQNGVGIAIAVGPQGFPWLVTPEGKIIYAGLFSPTSRSVNTETCAAPFSQAPAPVEPPSAALKLSDLSLALLPGASVDLLAQGTLNGRPLAMADVLITLNGNTNPLLSLQQGRVTLSSAAPLGSSVSASYTVCARQAVGACASANLLIRVADVPGAPTHVVAVADNARALVNFSAPMNSGGSPVTSYTVVSNPGNLRASGTASPITVTGLTNGIAYSFTVIANSALGSSRPSTASAPVVPFVPAPNAPSAVSATPGDRSAVISFTPPASTGGAAITGYIVTASPGNISMGGASPPIRVTGLTNGTSYTFTVVATSAVGNSAPSNASAPVTPVAAVTVPGAPLSVSALAGNGSATVNFAPPSSNGGSAITSYTATSNPGNLSASAATAPITVNGLGNGTSYTFTVIATSAAGNSAPSSASAPVTPSGPPSAPLSVTALAGDGAASVSFAAPLNNGGRPITGYTVTSNPGNFSASGAASPISVNGLTNGVNYTFTVVASSTAGTGPSSNASAPVMPLAAVSVPGAPTGVSAIGGADFADVSFSPPASDGGSPIISYTVTSSPGGISATGTGSPITVFGLTPLTQYTFTVVANSAVGSSAPSSASNPVTPGQ